MEVKLQKELQDAVKDLEKDAERSRKAVDAQLEEQKDKVIGQKEQAFEKEMLLKRKQLSEEKYNEILEQHKKEVTEK